MKTWLALVLLLIVLCTGYSAARGRGSGGSRSGGSRSSSYRGTTRYSSRYTSTKTYTYTVRSGSRTSSSYIRYIPSVRYSRVYVGFTGPYIYYYSLYFGFAGSPAYQGRRRPSGDVDVCVNYEANDNGTAMGVFTCPVHPSEPREYTNCCGEQYAEYCCKKEQTNSIYTWVIGVVVIGAIIIGIIRFIKRRSIKKREEVTTTTLATTVSHEEQGSPRDCVKFSPDGVHYHAAHQAEFPAYAPPAGYGPVPPLAASPPSYDAAVAPYPPGGQVLYAPGDQTPYPPGGQVPYAPGDQTPYPPGRQAPYAPSDQTPYPPGEQAPYAPSDQSPYPPGEQAPYAPSDQSPYPPSEQAPYAPSDQTPYPPGRQVPYPASDRTPYPPGGQISYPLVKEANQP